MKTKEKRFQPAWIYIIISVFLLLILFYNFSGVPLTTWGEFEKNMLTRHAVEKLVIVDNEIVEVYLKQEFSSDSTFKDIFKPGVGNAINPGPHYQFRIGSVDSFERKLDEAQKQFSEEQKVGVSYVKTQNWLTNLLPWLILFFLGMLTFRFLGSSGGGGRPSIFNFGKSTATLREKEDKGLTTFDDIAGLDEAKLEIREIVEFLKDSSLYTRLGAKIPKGVIIVGPPGTGKTLLAKAVAGEAKVPFFSLSGSEFVEMFVGVGASRVRDLFRRAKEKAPSIIFIDEIDAVGQSRGKNTIYTGANDERESTLNQLLTEMDGFGTNSGVIVLAATNRADMLDPALLRPGRFDRHIYLELPNYIERKAIFQVHLKPLVLADTVDTDFLASQTPGFSGADIANICNEAALIAARGRKNEVEKEDFSEALDRIVAGLEKKSKIISPFEKKIIAYHEAGHATVSWLLKHVDPLMKVSIIPRGKSLGAAWYLPEERQLKTLTELTEKISVALAGRAAEEIVFGEVSSGALDDLEKATKEAYLIIAYYGFNKKIGNVSFYDSTGSQRSAFQKPYSEDTGKIIDEEVRKLIDESYQRTRNMLLQHKAALTKIAELLLEKEVIFKDDIARILGNRTDNHEEIPVVETDINQKAIEPGGKDKAAGTAKIKLAKTSTGAISRTG